MLIIINLLVIFEEMIIFTTTLECKRYRKNARQEKIKAEIKSVKNVEKSKNLEEFWLRSVGKTLFDKTINNYNKKMWQVSSCKEIDSFKWSPKGYTIKKGKEAAYDDEYQCIQLKKMDIILILTEFSKLKMLK